MSKRSSLLALSVSALALAAPAADPGSFLHDLAADLGTTSGDALFERPRPKRALDGQLKVYGDYVGGNRTTGTLLATGGVTATSGVYLFRSDRITRDETGLYDLGRQALMTTCTNDVGHLHWHMRGHMTFRPEHEIEMHDLSLHYYNIPLLWTPYFYYPLNVDSDWRLMPGYNSRWGGYLLAGYVYTLYDEPTAEEDRLNLNAATYGEYRTKNGFALGQQLTWNLKQFGWGRVQGWYGWDQDWDRYIRHASDSYHYENWTSRIKRERYRIFIHHSADFTERDSFRLRAQYLSDNMVLEDFARRAPGRYVDIPINDMWYEHRENSWAAGVDVSGPVNKFYAGTRRLPEGWLDIAPQPVFELPVNYESQTRAGYLSRQYADLNDSGSAFAHNPYIGLDGNSAHYRSFRADTYHRLTAPMKFWDVLSVVPRAAYRCTWWNTAGSRESNYSYAAGSGMARHIGEAGITFSGRASSWITEETRHTFEPYLDYTFQRASLSSSGNRRYYYFDNYDSSLDWFDQFGFEGHSLPYSWHGIRPGIRNTFTERTQNDTLRTFLDTDLYLSLPFSDENRYDYDDASNPLRGYIVDQAYGNYAQRKYIVPGFRTKYTPTRDLSFGARIEYDTARGKPAYSDIVFQHMLTKSFSWNVSWLQQDYRIWDYLATPYRTLENGNTDRWNWEKNSVIRLGFRNQPIHWFAWSPYVQFNARDGEVENVGAFVDFLQDCIAYRFQANYYSRYTRIDGSRNDDEIDVSFFIYLRAMGPGSAVDMTLF